MTGTVSLPFSALFADTLRAHGYAWARSYYLRHGMQDWEFEFWANATWLNTGFTKGSK